MNFLQMPARMLALVFSFSFSFSSLHAQPVAALSEVVVTATRVPAPVSALSASVEVLTREDIEHSQAASLADVLRGVGGFEFARNGGPGTVTSFFLRGHNSANVMILVDGVRTPVDGIGAPLAVDLALAHVERIELMRGDASALYGSAANGGVIHIITRRGDGQYGQVGSGSRGRRSVQGGLSRSTGTVDLSIRLGQERSAALSAMNVDQKPKANRDADRSIISNAAIDLTHRIDADHQWRLSHSRVEAAVDYDDDAFGYGDPYDTHKLQRNSQSSALRLDSRWSADWRSQWALSQTRQTMEDRKNGVLRTSAYDFGLARSDQRGLRWVNQVALADHSLLMAGLEVLSEEFRTDASLSGYRFEKSDKAVFAGLTHQTGRWGWQINLRGDWLKTRNLLTSQVEDDSRTSALLGASYRLNPDWKITGQLSTGFRAASVGEQAYAAAPLRPETFFQRELGLAYKRAAHQLRVNYFVSDMKDMIAYDRNSDLSNLPARNQGLELLMRTRWAATDLSASLVVQDPQNKESGKPLARRAKRVAGLKAVSPLGAAQVSAAIRYHSHRRDSDFNERLLRPYTVLDLGMSYALSRAAKVSVSLENATDRVYQTAYGYNMPRRALWMSLNLQGQ